MNESDQKIIKNRIKNGSFFKDSRSWFYGKYISAYKSKFNLSVILFIIFITITLVVVVSIIGVTNVKAKNGIVKINSKSDSEFILSKIKKYYHNNETNILRFVIEKYVTVFESYDIERFEIYKLEDKVNAINRNSSQSVISFFQKNIRSNYVNEIFSDIGRYISINSIQFINSNDDFYDKIIKYITPESTPTKVIINLTSYAFSKKNNNILKQEDRLIEIAFSYKKIKRDARGLFSDLDFKVLSYTYLNIRQV